MRIAIVGWRMTTQLDGEGLRENKSSASPLSVVFSSRAQGTSFSSLLRKTTGIHVRRAVTYSTSGNSRMHPNHSDIAEPARVTLTQAAVSSAAATSTRADNRRSAAQQPLPPRARPHHRRARHLQHKKKLQAHPHHTSNYATTHGARTVGISGGDSAADKTEARTVSRTHDARNESSALLAGKTSSGARVTATPAGAPSTTPGTSATPTGAASATAPAARAITSSTVPAVPRAAVPRAAVAREAVPTAAVQPPATPPPGQH